MAWTPITANELHRLIAAQLANCSPGEVSRFERARVSLRAAPIHRSGNVEQVFIVAEHGGTVVYYEDVEEGFNLSRVDPAGFIASPGSEQWDLRHAMNRLFEGGEEGN